MGTRALTLVSDEVGHRVLSMYSQYDGYPSGLGADLHKALGHLRLVNGIGGDEKVANGMGCFAAQIVASLKRGAGGFYLQNPTAGVEGSGGIEFIYDFRPNILGYEKNRHLMLKVIACNFNDKVLYDGPFADFDPQAAHKKIAEGEEQDV